MKIYQGQRTEQGCGVTVDGRPLRMRSDLSGNATTPFDWGFVGTGQLSVALLADLLNDDVKAKALCKGFDQAVIAALPHEDWTRTDDALNAVLEPLTRAYAASAAGLPDESSVNSLVVDQARGAAINGDVAFGDMPIRTAGLAAEEPRRS